MIERLIDKADAHAVALGRVEGLEKPSATVRVETHAGILTVRRTRSAFSRSVSTSSSRGRSSTVFIASAAFRSSSGSPAEAGRGRR